MDILKVYFNDDDGKCRSLEFATSSWYHKPVIISAIAYKLQYYCNIRFLFACSSKYGYRQFPIEQSKNFPVHCLDFSYYKDKLPWIVAEFNDFADFNVYSPREFFNYIQILKDVWPDLFVDMIGKSELVSL